MIFLKHVCYKVVSREELRSIVDHVQETASRVRGVRMRDLFILSDRDEFIVVMECSDQPAYQRWRDLCPPPPGSVDWVDSAIPAGEFEAEPG
jgi:hypothetical protein